MNRTCLFFAVTAFSVSSALGQRLEFDNIEPGKIDWVFDITVSSNLEYKILESSGEKLELYDFKVSLNESLLDVKSANTRGNNTLKFRRKSFSVTLHQPIDFQGVEVRKLAINNMAMDRNYWRNRLSFLLMKEIGIFPLKNQFVELRLNKSTLGTYLAIQKTDDYSRSLGSNVLLRREYDGSLTLEDAHGDDAKRQLKRMRRGKKLAKAHSGQALYDSLNAIVMMDQYYKWLAFNYIVMNGDYTDEIFFYLDPVENRFNVIPWDYDDVFAPQPHEGWQKRNLALSDRLLFSGESYFDKVIDRDDYLYAEYLKSFDEVLTKLTPDVIFAAFQQVYTELYPYFNDGNIIAQSEHDQSGLTNLQLFQTDLQNHLTFTLSRHSALTKRISEDMASVAR